MSKIKIRYGDDNMFLINGKPADKLTEEDLKVLIDNEDYKENQYIDYKGILAFYDNRLPKEKRQQEAIEFKHDICSFANAEGGYLVVGVSEKGGIPDEIIGIDVPNGNKDKFELDIRDKLKSIQPKMPSIKLHFIELSDKKYIVIIDIQADGFTPYVYDCSDNPFFFFTRTGNGKRRMSYNQVMRMFNQSLVIQKEIASYRKSRIQFYSKANEKPRYCRVYVISDDFVNPSAHKKIYMMYRDNRSLISKPDGFEFIAPIVDGGRFVPYRNINCAAYFFNNGICELNEELSNFYLNEIEEGLFLSGQSLWKEIILKSLLYSFGALLKLGFSKRAFICFDIACIEKTITERRDYYYSKLDRDLILSNVIEVSDIANEDIKKDAIKSLHYELLMALGIKGEEKYQEVEKEIIFF